MRRAAKRRDVNWYKAIVAGSVYGRLTAIAPPDDLRPRMVRCVCICGVERMVRAKGLLDGASTSCGCSRIGKRGTGCGARKQKWPASRFWSHVNQSGGVDACWPFTGVKRVGMGYGVLYFDGREHRAHCLAWELFNSSERDGWFVLHGCDNPICCNPRHLRLGTHADNMADKVSRNRQASGERNGVSKLTADLVLQIRSSTDTQQAWADRLGVDRTAISAIRRRKNWKHL